MSSLIRKINIQFDLTTGLTTDYKQPARQVWAGSGRSGDVRRPRGRAPVIVTGILSGVSRQHDESGVEYAGEERRSTNSSNRCVGPNSDTRQRRYSVDLTTTTHCYGYTTESPSPSIPWFRACVAMFGNRSDFASRSWFSADYVQNQHSGAFLATTWLIR